MLALLRRGFVRIVPSSRGSRSAMLPFDGDDVLTVIMSKVALLATDHKIKDATILNQIRRRRRLRQRGGRASLPAR